MAATPETATGKTVAENADLEAALRKFWTANSAVESSALIDRAVADSAAIESSQALFPIPIQNGILSMEGALKWVLFLKALSTLEAADAAFDRTFSADAAMDLVVKVFDLGLQDEVWEHFEDDDDEDEDDDEDDDDDADE